MRLDLTGRRFGKLLVLRLDVASQKKGTRWVCLCDCGREKSFISGNLVNGHTAACGCIRSKHGMHSTPTYRSWIAMVHRCRNPKVGHHYCYYGGRGIKVCDRWESSFSAFLEDMGVRPSLRHSIDRINNDGNYEPENCKWSTAKEQNNNRRRPNRQDAIEFQGERRTIRDWAKVIGLSERTLGHRLRSGWPLEKALTEPLMLGRSKAGRIRHEVQKLRRA